MGAADEITVAVDSSWPEESSTQHRHWYTIIYLLSLRPRERRCVQSSYMSSEEHTKGQTYEVGNSSILIESRILSILKKYCWYDISVHTC